MMWDERKKYILAEKKIKKFLLAASLLIFGTRFRNKKLGFLC